jgi:hypothetical protein
VAEPDESEEQTRAYAALTSELIALTFRNMMTQAIQSNGVPSGIPSPQEVVKNLKQVMARLSI